MLWTRYVIIVSIAPTTQRFCWPRRYAASDVTCVWERDRSASCQKWSRSGGLRVRGDAVRCDYALKKHEAIPRRPPSSSTRLDRFTTTGPRRTAWWAGCCLRRRPGTPPSTKPTPSPRVRGRDDGAARHEAVVLLAGDAVARVLAAALRACKVHMCDDTVLHTYGFVEWQRTCVRMDARRAPANYEGVTRPRHGALLCGKDAGLCARLLFEPGLPHSANAVSAVFGAA